MDKCREDFEAWIIKSNVTGRVPNFIIKNDNGAYIDQQTADLWIAWKASRESMKAIKLPNAIKADNRLLGDNEYCSGYNQAIRDCEKQITSAGYEVE